MNARPAIMLLFVVLVPTHAAAHEDGVYETLSHIPIGRIFLTPDQRAYLDGRRGSEPARPSRPRPAANTRKRVSGDDAAGFIVSDSGTTRVWRNGDFVPTASASVVRFPGQVRIDSHPVRQEARDTGDAEEHVGTPVGAENDED